MKLVEIKKFELFTQSDLIAQGVNKSHDTVIKLIDRNLNDLNEFGEVGFEIRAGYNNAQVRVAILNEQQATLLITYMRNNEKVIKFKKTLVKAFFDMRSLLSAKINDRNIAKIEYRPMTDALKYELEIKGKIPKHYDFSNEANLINRIALGMTASKFKDVHHIGKSESIRDHLTPCQIKCITDLQRANTTFIQLGMEFEERKLRLMELFKRNHIIQLFDEQQRIAA
ncbi:hypothetical protein B6D12_06065 [Gilliamella apicola]|uniref:Rha family transcriptional regulator n=1 Tax=Gilliamella apicola TaxID=1196095 RepID=UPI000A333DDD|nr:Rha family transcriptional regulator [Gilliamella apicola]OTP90502.1 hypothetical protein B5S41_03705 [Gilliamella apicola]OTP93769.1 hypothetical protein B6D13_09170 [Gilliamella apicola]OTQ00736.1 hypothetical protein B6D07_09870 [Gilliamella apicola]OTQ05726.1 hypothetical protein B6D12_06065 [Gilliamella apicola]OTQ30421.1 hypothetical protein B6D02_05410 [Gilliamella apicola]